jgi:hypothetical protein
MMHPPVNPIEEKILLLFKMRGYDSNDIEFNNVAYHIKDNLPVITGDRDTDALLEDERIAQSDK